VGSWNALDAIAIADCALEIHGGDLDDLFATAGRALADVMGREARHATIAEGIALSRGERRCAGPACRAT
jgi:hypothetical protein